MRGERDVKARTAVLAALREGLTLTEAARRAGVSRQAVYLWLRRGGGDEELAQAVEATRKARWSRREPKRSPDAATRPAGASEGSPAPAPPQAAPPLPPPASAPAPPPPGLTDEDVMRLRRLGLGVLAEVARGGEGVAPSARVQAARALTEHAERWEVARRLEREQAALHAAMPAPPPAAAPPPAEPEDMDPEAAVAALRVVV